MKKILIFILFLGLFSSSFADEVRVLKVTHNSITIAWSPPNIGTPLRFFIYKNDVNIGITSQTTITIENLSSCTHYNIAVRSDYAAFAGSTSATTLSTLPATITLQSVINLSNYSSPGYIPKANTSILLKPGFEVKGANANGNIFQTRIESGCGGAKAAVVQTEDISQEMLAVDTVLKITTLNSLLQPMADEKSILIYPNPTSGMITVEYANFEGGEKVVIMDVMGKVLHQSSLIGSISSIDLSDFPSGSYFVKITTPKASTYLRKIIRK